MSYQTEEKGIYQGNLWLDDHSLMIFNSYIYLWYNTHTHTHSSY